MSDIAIGILIGLVIAAVVGGLGAYFFFRDKHPVFVSPAVPASTSSVPAMTTFLTVPFLNQQLEKILVADLSEPSKSAAAPQKLGPVKIKLTGATLELGPDRGARLLTHLTATAIGLPLRLAPVTEFTFVPERGRARIIVTRISLEGVNIPLRWVEGFIQSYISDAEAELNQILGELHNETGINLSDIETTTDILTLKFAG